MDGLIQKLKALSSANEFLDFFGIEYDERVVHVNRLHILKRFYQYLHRADSLDTSDRSDPLPLLLFLFIPEPLLIRSSLLIINREEERGRTIREQVAERGVRPVRAVQWRGVGHRRIPTIHPLQNPLVSPSARRLQSDRPGYGSE